MEMLEMSEKLQIPQISLSFADVGTTRDVADVADARDTADIPQILGNIADIDCRYSADIPGDVADVADIGDAPGDVADVPQMSDWIQRADHKKKGPRCRSPSMIIRLRPLLAL